MKKMTAVLSAAFLFLLLLAGCHGKIAEKTQAPTETVPAQTQENPAQTAPPERKATIPDFDESKKINISFWAKNDSNPTQIAIYKKAIEEFEALYPNVKVELRLYSDYAKIYQDVITNIATSTTPNVCVSYPDHIATYLKGQDIVAALDEYMAHEKYGLGGSGLRFDGPSRDEMIEKFLDEGFFNNHQYDLPFMRSSEALYINKTYVEAMGYEIPEIVSWDWIWEVSEAAMEKRGDVFKVNGQKIMIPFIYKSTDNMMIQMLRQKGAGYATERGNVLLFNDTAKEIMFTIYEHVKTRAFSTFKIDSYPGNFFNAGRCLFAIDSTAGSTWLGSKAPLLDIHAEDVAEFETAVRPVPQFDVNNPQMISQGPSLCLFQKKDAQEVLASWLFAQYLLTNAVQVPYSQTEGYVPVTSKAVQSAEYQDYLSRAGEDNKQYYDIKIAVSKMVMEYADSTFITPVFAGSTSVRDAAGALIENVAKGTRRNQAELNAAGDALSEEYIQKVFTEVQKLYKLSEIEVIPDGSAEPESAPQGSGTKTQSASREGAETGSGEPLPAAAAALLAGLAGIWLLLGVLFFVRQVRGKKGKES